MTTSADVGGRTSETRAKAAHRRRQRWAERCGRSPGTVTLLTICVGAFLVTLALCTWSSSEPWASLVESLWMLECGRVLEMQGALVLARVWIDGEWWRVVTTVFVHGSVVHVVVNGWSLWVVGEWAEAAWGSARMLGLFVVASVAGCLASLAWCEAPVVVGASGGVMGLAGGLLVARTLGKEKLRSRLEPVSPWALGGFLGVLVLIGWFVPVIAQAGHIGGLAAGSLLGFGFSRERPAWRHGVLAIGIVGLLALLVGQAAAPSSRASYHELSGYRHLELGQSTAAARAFDEALALRPDDSALANAVAYALAESGEDLERAEVLVRRALADQPENSDYLDTLGWILCRAGRTQEGLEALQRAEEAATRAIPEIELHLRDCRSAVRAPMPR